MRNGDFLLSNLILSIKEKYGRLTNNGSKSTVLLKNNQFKNEILLAISAINKGETSVNDFDRPVSNISANRLRLLNALKAIEESNKDEMIPIESLDGEWSLIYSTQLSQREIHGIYNQNTNYLEKSVINKESFIDEVTGKLYKIFFKFAPFLAGSQQEARKNFDDLLSIKTSNTQSIGLQSNKILNKVFIRMFNGNVLIELNVEGKIRIDDSKQIKPNVIVIFTSFSVKINQLPRLVASLPSPTGNLLTTYCDGDLRISRGGRGGIFIVKKIKMS
jgi:hypothetical protein